jgi:hypothetical protein
MKYLLSAFSSLTISLCTVAGAQSLSSATSESRDASTAYIGTSNFVVGRVGRDCLNLLGRTETPQEFVGVWQQRNIKYLKASQKYLDLRFEEAERTGGPERRKAIMSELTITVRSGSESTVKSWLDRPDKAEACKRAVALIESGTYDFSPTSPMFTELESLVAWAQH